MQRRLKGPAAVALALGLIALVFLPGLGSSHGVPASAAPAAPRPAIAASIEPADSSNFPQFSFNVGLSTGKVYFDAYDGVGDILANITLNDQNASRDGLHNPVASWTANFSISNYNNSADWAEFYALPLDLAFGGQWNITLEAPNAGFLSTNFSVVVFDAQVTSGQSVYLPGTSATLIYQVYKTANDAPIAPTSLTLTGNYELANFTRVALWGGHPMSISPTAVGSTSFLVPLTALPNTAVDYTLFANVTSGSGTASATYRNSFEVGNLTTSLSLSASLGGASISVLPGNSPAILTVLVEIVGGFYYADAANISVSLAFRNPHGAAVSPIPGNPPLTLTTNLNGLASILFLASNSTFVPFDTYTIWENSTQTGGPGASWNNTLTFSVLGSTSGEGIQLLFGQEAYYGGDTATLTWWTGGTGGIGSSGTWTVDDWFVAEASAGYRYFAEGTIGSTASTGSFSVTAPMAYTGDLYAVVQAHNATMSIDGVAEAYVAPPSILLSPSEYLYLPGDTISVGVSTQGSALSSATLYWTADGSDGDGAAFATGTVSGGSFSFTTPSITALGTIRVNVTAVSSSAGVVSSQSVYIETSDQYDLQAGIQTASSYADGSYQPGQTIQIHYNLVSLRNAPAPGVFALYIETDHYVAGGGYMQFQTSSTSGTFGFHIPSNWGTGTQYLYIYAEFQNCPTGSCYAETDFAIPVESSPPALNYELGAGSGLTLGWLILLIVILVVALLLVLMIRRRPPAGGSTPIQPYQAGSSGGAAGTPAWSEGTGTPKSDPGASNPPLPNPPAGGAPPS